MNKLLPKALEADGIVLGAPVHYASAAGQASCAYDRLFVMSNGAFANKLGAAGFLPQGRRNRNLRPAE